MQGPLRSQGTTLSGPHFPGLGHVQPQLPHRVSGQAEGLKAYCKQSETGDDGRGTTVSGFTILTTNLVSKGAN